MEFARLISAEMEVVSSCFSGVSGKTSLVRDGHMLKTRQLAGILTTAYCLKGSFLKKDRIYQI
jgi:hypothetical protein